MFVVLCRWCVFLSCVVNPSGSSRIEAAKCAQNVRTGEHGFLGSGIPDSGMVFLRMWIPSLIRGLYSYRERYGGNGKPYGKAVTVS